MSSHQDQFDDAMFDYSTGEYAVAISKFQAILAEDPDHFDARLGLAMCHYRLGDYATAIAEGRSDKTIKQLKSVLDTLAKYGGRYVALRDELHLMKEEEVVRLYKELVMESVAISKNIFKSRIYTYYLKNIDTL